MKLNIDKIAFIIIYVIIFPGGIVCGNKTIDTGTIEIFIKDQNDNYRSGIEIIRYNSLWQKVDSKITDSNFKAGWSGLSLGEIYHFEAYNSSEIVPYSEYWGSVENLTVTGSNTQTAIIKRVMPYSYEVRIFDINNNSSAEFNPGDTVKIIIDIENNDIITHNVKIQSQADKNKGDLVDFEETSSYNLVPPKSSYSIEFFYNPTEAGNYFVRPKQTFTYINGDQLTDSWDWPDSISFKVVEDSIKTIQFSGITWNVKDGYGSPRNNYWSSNQDNVWVDSDGALHLKIQKVDDVWYCSEIWTDQSFGFGDYIFKINSRIDLLDQNVVFGLFIYKNLGMQSTPQEYEIDMEFSSWQGQIGTNNALYVFQYREGGDINNSSLITPYLYNFALNGINSTHKFIWESNKITFQSYHGHYDTPPDSNYFIIPEKVFYDSRVPPASDEKLHINLWLNDFNGPSDDNEVEIIINSFSHKNITGTEEANRPVLLVYQNYPNPFKTRTTIPVEISESGIVSLEIFDSRGILTKTIINHLHMESGIYNFTWDGTNSGNQAVSSGIYYFHIRTGNNILTKRCVLMR